MDKKIIGLMFVFFMMFSIFAAMIVFEQPISQLTRAKEETLPVADQTRVLAWPLYDVKANGKASSAITVIVRNSKTKPIEGRLVKVNTTLGNFSQTTASTNKQGMAVFQLTSTTPGTATVDITIDDTIKVPQTVTVQFTE